MTLSTADLKTLLKAGENNRVAFLPSITPERNIAHILVAMANCTGGMLIVGGDKNGVQGLPNAEETSNQIVDIALSLTPRLMISMPQVISANEKSCVVTEIPRGLPNVYAYQGHYLQRDNTNNVPISPNQLRRLMIERGEFSYESEVAHQSTLDDIDWKQAEIYTKTLAGMSHLSMQDILYQRGCLAKIADEFVPTNAGILLFGKYPKQFIHSAEITAVRFASESMTDTFNRQDIIGTLPEQIRRTETFLADHLRKSVTLSDKMKREEDYEYPMEAVRELVINAVAHRDYSIQGDNIRLYMYSDHLEVHSPGSLPGPMTLENLKEERFSRNPVIVQVLSDMGFIERLGYGVDRVIELMASQSLESPTFTNTSNGFKVHLSRQSIPEVEPKVISIPEAKTPQSTIEHFNGVFMGQEINPRQESALVYLHQESNSRITNSDLKSMFPDVHPETIRRDLVDLVNKNILQKMGQKRGSYYVLAQPQQSHDT